MGRAKWTGGASQQGCRAEAGRQHDRFSRAQQANLYPHVHSAQAPAAVHAVAHLSRLVMRPSEHSASSVIFQLRQREGRDVAGGQSGMQLQTHRLPLVR